MNILITVGIFPPDIGGPATQIDAFCRELIKKGIKPMVLTFGDFTTESDYPYMVTKISRRLPQPFRNLLYGIKVFRLARKNDLIYTEDLYSAGFFSFLASKFLGKKLVSRFAGDSAWELAQLNYGIRDNIMFFQKKKYNFSIELKKWLRRFVLIKSDKVIAVSDFMKKLAIMIGVSEKRIKMIYNSVDFKAPVIEADKIKKGEKKIKVLVTAGRLVPWKNMDVFFHIMPELVKKYKDINLLIIGSGPEEERLKIMVKDMSLSKNIKFLGKVAHGKIMNYFADADIFVLNTNYEGLSHTILEAMSVGVPVISTNVDGNPEVVRNNHNGLLVEYDNKKQWIEAIEKLLDNPELRRQFIEEAKKDLHKFNWQKLINETVELFKKL